MHPSSRFCISQKELNSTGEELSLVNVWRVFRCVGLRLIVIDP
jgi:hypothetical protein